LIFFFFVGWTFYLIASTIAVDVMEAYALQIAICFTKLKVPIAYRLKLIFVTSLEI